MCNDTTLEVLSDEKCRVVEVVDTMRVTMRSDWSLDLNSRNNYEGRMRSNVVYE